MYLNAHFFICIYGMFMFVLLSKVRVWVFIVSVRTICFKVHRDVLQCLWSMVYVSPSLWTCVHSAGHLRVRYDVKKGGGKGGRDGGRGGGRGGGWRWAQEKIKRNLERRKSKRKEKRREMAMRRWKNEERRRRFRRKRRRRKTVIFPLTSLMKGL